jgi:hypothetical protein
LVASETCLDAYSPHPYTGVVSLEKIIKELGDWGLWEYGGVALLAVARALFAGSSQPPPSAASDPGMTLTPKGWEKDNSRLSAAKNPRSARLRRSSAKRHSKFMPIGD